jgi:catechol 2,3-dioxygenase-like lactoylglutathione lyase family enzyme
MDPAKTSTDGMRGTRWRGIDHVQLAMPVGGEDVARSFFVDRLGFEEEPKPPAMAERGGAWFRSGDTAVHVGAEADFSPARKAHPAFRVVGLRQFVAETGLEVRWSDEIPGVIRCHLDDPFGNRIELVDAAPNGQECP